VVNQYVSQSYRVRPYRIRVALAQFFAEAARRLADDLQVIKNPNLELNIVLKLRSSRKSSLQNAVYRTKDIS